jgi:hypothetical protein
MPHPGSVSEVLRGVEVSYLPPMESVLERFVTDRRRARTSGEDASAEYQLEAAE